MQNHLSILAHFFFLKDSVFITKPDIIERSQTGREMGGKGGREEEDRK